jgi:DNA polymerase-3 subunit gamma/tau
MGKAFYRKYRSKSLSEVVGQSHITDSLQTALKNGAISHAYLFTGPRGVGKTSVARILAHEINNLPYNDESTHLDIIEIDAASNRRIDEIRDLKDKVNIAPTSAKYKVYIIDEVHMLTKEAFNALLKTLEEPPAHVVFILATTEAHKLPETIISRTQRYTFKPVEQEAVVKHLASIAKEENIEIDNAALNIIAEHGEGSFRDSISLLDQMRHSSKAITEADIELALGIAPKNLVQQTVQAIIDGDRQAIDSALSDIVNKGIDLVQFAHQLSVVWRNQLISQGDFSDSDLKLLDELSRIGTHPSPGVALALALYRPLAKTKTITTEPAEKPVVKSESRVADMPVPKPDPEPAPMPEPTPAAEPLPPAPDDVPERTPSNADLSEWENILKALKQRHNTLYGVVRMAEPTLEEDKLTLAFSFPFHMRRIAEEKNRHVIEEVIHEAIGKRLSVVAIKLEKKAQPKPLVMPAAIESESLKSVSNIFGGAEIVES